MVDVFLSTWLNGQVLYFAKADAQRTGLLQPHVTSKETSPKGRRDSGEMEIRYEIFVRGNFKQFNMAKLVQKEDHGRRPQN